MKKNIVRAVFLDRDGVINKYPGDFEYVKSWEEFCFLPKVSPALIKLNRAGFKVFVCSNQAGVSKGLYSQAALDRLTRNMLSALRAKGALIDGVFYCTHRSEHKCSCRKPKAGLVRKAVSFLKKSGMSVDIKKSFFIGDTIRDVRAGKSMGLTTILVFSGKEKTANKKEWALSPDMTADNLYKAAELIV